ncbi:MAG: hypothetical protein V4594_01945, partial [Bacteroidota bacterium]
TNLSKEEQEMYDQDLKRKRDNEAARVNSVEEGRAKGRYEQALEIAAELKKRNIPLEIISEATKLSIEELDEL